MGHCFIDEFWSVVNTWPDFAPLWIIFFFWSSGWNVTFLAGCVCGTPMGKTQNFGSEGNWDRM